MYELEEPNFFQYLDENGKMKPDAPESAKKAFKDWQNDNVMKVLTKGIKTHKIDVLLPSDSDIYHEIEKIATANGVSFETVLEVLVAKGLYQHLEKNLEWIRGLDGDPSETLKILEK